LNCFVSFSDSKFKKTKKLSLVDSYLLISWTWVQSRHLHKK